MEMGSLHTELRFAATKHVAFLSVEEKYGRAAPEEEGKPARRRRSQALTPDWAGAVYSLARRTEGGASPQSRRIREEGCDHGRREEGRTGSSAPASMHDDFHALVESHPCWRRARGRCRRGREEGRE
jgi:hypothetical protein